VTRLPWQPWGTLCYTLVCFSTTPTWFYYKLSISIVRSWTAQPCRTWNIDTHCKWCLMFSLSDQLSSSRWTSSQGGGISCVCFLLNDLICCAWSKKHCKTHSVCWALPPEGHSDYRIRSNFWKFYLIGTGFFWWKCLDCLDWNRLFLVFRVWTK
jgi:hypothetical protein